ncbi:hypothetical protein HK096_005711, partial [Nowakowskiella sp. JEL0078]
MNNTAEESENLLETDSLVFVKTGKLGTFPSCILEKLHALKTDLSVSISVTSDVLKSLHDRSDIIRTAQHCIGTVSDGLGFVEALLFSKIDSNEPKAAAKKKKSSASIPVHVSERIENVKRKAQEKNGNFVNHQIRTSPVQNAQEQHGLIEKDISAIAHELSRYIEILTISANNESLSSAAHHDYGLESPNPDAVNLKATIIRRLQTIDFNFNLLSKIITNIYSRQTLAIISWKYFQNNEDAKNARLQMDNAPGGVILRLGARVASMFSTMMTSMNNVSTALPLQPLDLKNAVGELIMSSNDLIGCSDVFFSQLEKTCRSTGAKANLPSTCETYMEYKTQIPIAVKNLTDLILRVIYYSQNYWHSGARESRRQIRLASQNFEDILAQLAHVVLENANSPTKDDPSLIPDTLYWIRDTRFTLQRGPSNSSVTLNVESSPSVNSINYNSAMITPKREHSLERIALDTDFIHLWSRRIKSLGFSDIPSRTPPLNPELTMDVSNLNVTELRFYMRNLSKQLGIRLNETFLSITEHPQFSTQICVDTKKIENADRRLDTNMEELQIMASVLLKEVSSIFTARNVISSGDLSDKIDPIERKADRITLIVNKLTEVFYNTKNSESPSISLFQMLDPLNTLLDYAISITKYMDNFLHNKEMDWLSRSNSYEREKKLTHSRTPSNSTSHSIATVNVLNREDSMDSTKNAKFDSTWRSLPKKKSVEESVGHITNAFKQTFEKLTPYRPNLNMGIQKTSSMYFDEIQSSQITPSRQSSQTLINKSPSRENHYPSTHENITHIFQYLENDRQGIEFEFEFDAMFTANQNLNPTGSNLAGFSGLTPLAVDTPTVKAAVL